MLGARWANFRNSSTRRLACQAAGTPKRVRLPRSRQELQKEAQVEYLRNFYENADRIEDGTVTFRLEDATPREKALQQQESELAELNQRLCAAIAALASWAEMLAVLDAHAPQLNYVNVSFLAWRAGELAAQELTPAPAELRAALAPLVLQHASWFQAHHFAQSGVGLAAAGVVDAAFWRAFMHASDRKVASFTFAQLAPVCEALAHVGFVPTLNWLDKAGRQALKHYGAATAPQIAALLWAWGEFGYTPNEKIFLEHVKSDVRLRMKRRQLGAAQLVQVGHGVARWARFHPSERWMHAYASEVARVMSHLTPGEVVDALVALVSLGYRPPGHWLERCLQRLEAALGAPSAPLQPPRPAAAAAEDPPPAAVLQVEGMQRVASLLQQELGAAAGAPGGVGGDAGAPDDDGSGSGGGGVDAGAPDDDDGGLADRRTSGAAASSSSATDAPAGLMGRPSTAGGGARDVYAGAAAFHPGLLTQLRWALTHRRAAGATLSGSQLALLAWCFCALGFLPPAPWMSRYVVAVRQQAAALDAPGVVDVLHGLAGLDCSPPEDLLRVLLRRSEQLLPQMAPEALARLACAVVQLAVTVEAGWVEAWRASLEAQLGLCRLQELSLCLASLAQWGVQPPGSFMAAAVERAVALLPDAQPPPIATLLWALARLGYKPAPGTLHQLLAALHQKLHLLEARALADVAWALACLRHRPGTKWLGDFRREVGAKAGFLEAQALVDVLWALACFGDEPDAAWGAEVAAALAARATELTPGAAAAAAWAVGQLGSGWPSSSSALVELRLQLRRAMQAEANVPAQAAVSVTLQ